MYIFYYHLTNSLVYSRRPTLPPVQLSHKLNRTPPNLAELLSVLQKMGHFDDQLHQLNGLDERFAHGVPLKRPNSLTGPEHDFINRNIPPPDPRPPALGYMPLLEPRAELSHNFSQDPYHFADRRTDRTLNGNNLSLRTMTNTASMPEYAFLERAGTGSPSQRAQSTQSAGTLSMSAMYPPPRLDEKTDEAVTSPRNDRLLPSFHQLSKIADSATEATDTRTTGLPAVTAYAGQVIAQTVATSLPHYPPSQQSSPSSNFMLLGHTSPTNTRADGHEMYAPSQSQAQFTAPNDRNPRRRSAQHVRPPSFIPSITSSSMGNGSSTDTMGSLQSRQSSDAGGRSTANTTPMDSTPSSLDGITKAVPRLQTSTSAPGGFLCDHPGCAAPPFQTQYLLK